MPSLRRAQWAVPLISLVASRPLHRARLAVVAGAIFCASVIALAAFSLWVERQETLRDAQRELINLGHALGEQVAQRFDSIDFAIKAALNQLGEPLQQGPAGAQAARVLGAHADALAAIKGLGLYGPSGERIAASTDGLRELPVTLAGSEALAAHRSGRAPGLHFSIPARGGPGEGWHIIVSRAALDGRGELRGIIAAVLDPRTLAESYRSIDLGADATVALLDWHGTVLAAHPWRDDVIGQSFVEASVLKDPSAHEAGDPSLRINPFDKQAVLAANTSLRSFPLTLTVMADRRAVLAAWRRHAVVSGIATTLTGALALALGVLLDRHVRRREESMSQLRENQAELTEAQRIARLGSWRINAATGTIEWSAQAAALLGVPAQHVRTFGQLLQLVMEDDRARVETACAGLLESGTLDVEFRTSTVAGEVRWLQARAESIPGGRKPPLARGTLVDVTAQRHAQQAVQHLAAIVESTEDAILSIADDGRILSWNRGATRMFRLHSEAAIGRRLSDLLPARKAAQAARLVARSAAGDTIEGVETKLVLEDRRAIHIAVTFSPLRDPSGRASAASAVARDITSRREDELRQHMEHRIAQLLAEPAALETVMPRIIETLCRSTSFDCGLQWDAESDAAGYRLACVWRKRESDAARFESSLPRHIDRCDAAFLGHAGDAPRWLDAEEIALGQPWLGVTGRAFSNALLIPVPLGDHVVCVLELLTTRDRAHDGALLASAKAIGSQISQFLERRRAEDDLRAEKEYIAHVIAAAPTLIATIGPDGTTRSVNQAVHAIAGYLPTELQGRSFWQALEVDDATAARLLTRAVDGGAADYPLLIRAQAGDLRDLAVSASVRKGPDGSVLEYVLVGTDVTARRLDEARRATEYAVARTLTEGRSEHEALEAILGKVCELLDWDCAVYRTSDPVTRHVSSDCSWSKPNASLRALVSALSTPRLLGPSTLYWRTVDSRRPQWDNDLPGRLGAGIRSVAAQAGICSAMSVPVQAGERILGTLQFFGRGNNRPERMLVEAMQAIGHQVGRFIEHRRVEAARLQADERLRNIAANIPGIVFEYRLRPDGTAAFEFVSERSVDMLEERPETLMRDARAMFKVVDPEYRRQLLRSMRVSRLSRSLWWCEMPIRTASGRVRWVRGQSMPKYLDDDSVVWDGVIVDVTAQKQAEHAIQQMNEQLERRVAERTAQLSAANRELESFAYSVSHDLRAPLRSIDGFSRILVEEYGHTLEPTAADYLARVRNASQRMGKLIDDLLSLSRVTRSDLKRIRTDLSAIAEAIVQELRAESPERTVDVSIHPGMFCLADPSLIRIALHNLLGNAWKFTSKRASASIEFGALIQRSKTVYYVRDDGAGFDMAHAGKLFGAFQRLHSPREFEGTGVGLATVSRIIDRHGGTVWAESVLDKGTTFYFTLAPGAARA